MTHSHEARTTARSNRFRFALALFALIPTACASVDHSTPAPRSVEPEMLRIGDVAEPLARFERFLELYSSGTLDSDEGRELLGERLAPRNFDDRPDTPVGCDAIQRIGADTAVARITGRELDAAMPVPAGEYTERLHVLRPRDVNWYFTLERTAGEPKAPWRVTRACALALTGFYEYMLVTHDELQASRGALGWYVRALFDVYGWDMGSESDTDFENIRLTLASDQELRRWFGRHRAELDELAACARRSEDRARQLALSLHLSNHDFEGERLRLAIGGMSDNVVGFFHIQTGAAPAIGSDEGPTYIWVEPLGDGWFLFRTT